METQNVKRWCQSWISPFLLSRLSLTHARQVLASLGKILVKKGSMYNFTKEKITMETLGCLDLDFQKRMHVTQFKCKFSSKKSLLLLRYHCSQHWNPTIRPLHCRREKFILRRRRQQFYGRPNPSREERGHKRVRNRFGRSYDISYSFRRAKTCNRTF